MTVKIRLKKKGFCTLQYLCLCVILRSVIPDKAEKVHNYRRREKRELLLTSARTRQCFLD